MTGGTIYNKTIEASNQNGSDKCLILDPNYAYRVPFSFGTDWNRIRVGVFLSYTGSASDPNTSLASILSGGPHSSGTSLIDRSYLGIISSGDKFIPGNTRADGSFAGLDFNEIDDLESIRAVEINGILGSSHRAAIRTTMDDSSLQSNDLIEEFYVPEDGSGTTGFFSVLVFEFELVNKGGATTQELSIETYYTSSANRVLDDPSTAALISFVNGTGITRDAESNGNNPYQFNDGVSAAPIPDAFFFYNAFTSIRPRIHNVYIKKFA